MSLLAPAPPLSELQPRQIRWIAGGYVSMLSSLAGQTFFIALFGAHIRSEFGLSDGQFGLLYTLATLGSAMCLVAAGRMADKIPAAIVGSGATLSLALVSLLMGLAGEIWMLGLALFGLRFFGQGLLTLNAITALGRWFNRFRGRALALAQLGFSTGEAVLPFAVALGIAGLGWRTVWFVTAGALALVLAPAILWCFANPPDGKKARAAGLVNPDSGAERLTGGHYTRRRVLALPLFWIVMMGVATSPAISTAIFFHQMHLIGEKGWDLLIFAGFFPVMAASSIIASLGTGWLIDRFAAYRLMPIFLLPLGTCCLVIALLTPVWTIPVFFFLLGLSNGMVGTTISALWAELFGTVHLGAVRAMVTAGTVLASAIGPGIVGGFIDLGFSLPGQGFALAAYCFAISVFYFFLRERLRAQVAATAAS
ncbi:MFS transporter [Pelagibacterium limicola]|uniref:MFS transporter n=1 Tax=Pelagibacterium limicola TaxID=2791022 RepID=UPI0018AF98AC|nr:MFS transporter [Pelagibacterium limicola]